MTKSTEERWYIVTDSAKEQTHIRASGYSDAADQLIYMRRKQGRYTDVPEYDAINLLIGGPINPLRVEMFEYTNQGNGMVIDSFAVVLEDDYLKHQQEAHAASMAREQPPYWLRSGRHG